jgi:hypothetical protein
MKTEFVGNPAFEALGAMLDRLLEVDLDRPHGNSEKCGDFAVGQAFDARKDQHAASAVGKLRDRALEQFDLGAILDYARRIRSVIGDVEEAIDLVDGEAAALRPPAVIGNVERNAKHICLRIPHWPDLVNAFEAEKCFLEHVGSKVR